MTSDLLESSTAIVPPALFTSSSERTLLSSDSGTVAVPLVEPLTICLPETTASVWA